MNDLVARDRARLWHPYTQMKSAPPPIPIARAEGVWLETTDGRRILDGISSWWVNIHGHNHPRLNGALTRQASTLEHVMFAGFTHEPAVALAERLVEVLPPGLERVFYSDDGSTAVEVALKMAYQYWRNQREDRRTFVSLEHAYHGDTFGAMAASARGPFTSAFEPLLFDVQHAVAPFAENVGAILRTRGSDVAAVIVEPLLQGAGGMRVWRENDLVEIRRQCDQAGVLLIADEVFTGFGRTGTMFACSRAGVRPDIVCLSKSLTAGYLPLGATVCTSRVYDAFLSDDRAKTFFHGHSYTANPLACAVALESLRIFHDEPVLQRVNQLERRFQIAASTLRALPDVVDVRVIGGMIAVELGGGGGYLSDVGERLYRRFLDRGVLLRPLGNIVYFLPPYVIEDAAADMVLEIMEEELARAGTAP